MRTLPKFTRVNKRNQNGSKARQIADHLRLLKIEEALELANESERTIAHIVGIGVGQSEGREFATEFRAGRFYAVRTR